MNVFFAQALKQIIVPTYENVLAVFIANARRIFRHWAKSLKCAMVKKIETIASVLHAVENNQELP